jgi:hypothetical protein
MKSLGKDWARGGPIPGLEKIPSILTIPQSVLRAVVVIELRVVRLWIGEWLGGAHDEPFSVTSVTSVVTDAVTRFGSVTVAAEDVVAR